MAQTAPPVIVLRAGTWAATSARRSSSTLPFGAPRNTLPSQEVTSAEIDHLVSQGPFRLTETSSEPVTGSARKKE